MTEKIQISFTEQEAVVSLEFVVRINKSGQIKEIYEQRVLWNLEAMLEKEISFIFGKRYGEVLEEAKKNVPGLDS